MHIWPIKCMEKFWLSINLYIISNYYILFACFQQFFYQIFILVIVGVLALLLSSVSFHLQLVICHGLGSTQLTFLKFCENRRKTPYEVKELYHLGVRKTTSVAQRHYFLAYLRDKNDLFSEDTRLFLQGNSFISAYLSH